MKLFNFLKPHKGWTKDIYNVIVRWLVYGLVVLMPLFFLPYTSGVSEYNKQMLLVVGASVGAVLWLLGVVVSGKLTVRSSPIDKGILAVLVAAVVATIFSIAPSMSIFGTPSHVSSALVTLIALSVFYFLVVNVFHDNGRMVRRLISISTGIALIVGFLQLMGWYLIPVALTHARTFNTVGSFNALGILAALLLPFFVKTMGRNASVTDRVIGITGVVAALATLIALNWWVLWAVMLCGLLTMIAFDSLNATQLADDYGGARRGRFALSRFILPVMVIVLGAVLLLIQFNFKPVKSHLPVEVAPSFRLSWQVTKSVFGQKLIYGYGLENFSLAFDRFGASALANTQFSDARFSDGSGTLITMAIQNGVLGLLAFGFLLWCIWQVIARFGATISASVSRKEGALIAAQSSGTLAALVAMVAAMALYPFTLTLVFCWFVFLALAGLIVVGEGSKTIDIEERPAYSLAASLGFVIILILVLTGMYFSSVRYIGDIVYARALQQDTRAKILDGITTALSFNSTDDQYLRDASGVSLQLLADEVAQPAKAQDANRASRIQNLISAAVQYAQQATVVAPLQSLNWNNLGQVYQSLSGLVDNVEQPATEAYRKASDLRPGDPNFDSRIGTMWLNRAEALRQILANAGGNASAVQSQIDNALTQSESAFKRVLDVAPDLGMALYDLGAVYERQGKISSAITQLEKVVPYNADNSTLIFQLGLLYIRAGQAPNALAAMQRAVLLNPQDSNARWYLALLLEAKGDIQGALDQLYTIQQSNPDNATLQQKIDQLQAGQRAIPPAKVIDSKPIK